MTLKIDEWIKYEFQLFPKIIKYVKTGYSIPAMEDRMVRTRGARYVSYQQNVPMICPQCSRRNTDERFFKPKSN